MTVNFLKYLCFYVSVLVDGLPPTFTYLQPSRLPVLLKKKYSCEFKMRTLRYAEIRPFQVNNLFLINRAAWPFFIGL